MRPSFGFARGFARGRTRAFRLLSASLLAALLGLFGCTEAENVDAKTQVTLRIQLQEAPLFEGMTHVRISVFRQEGEKWVKADGAILRKEAVKWPIDIPIVPSSQASASKPFEAIVEALSGDTRLSQTRVISSYATNSLRVLEIWLYACTDTTEGACSEDSCHGPGCSTCSAVGACAPVSVVDPSELPFFNKEESPEIKGYRDPGFDMDAGVDAGGGEEAGPIVTESPDAETALSPPTCNPACSASAECVVSGTSAKCTCAAGFEDMAGTCQDIDECAKDSGGCSANATCQNTLGARNCACKPGFDDVRGNGIECVDKCAAAGCDPRATCAIVGTEAVCTCPSPYVGDGKTCTFDQSCSLLNCDAHATCVVNGTARECKCGSGYTGSGTACTNVNECMQTTNPCGANSTCTDTDGAYTCGCVTGYRRNGNVCENINDCSPNPCLNGGACTDGVNTRTCTCAAGYNGMNCQTNINDCSPDPCLNGGSCSDGVNTHTCTCAAGYNGMNCQTNINDCSPNPCLNGGSCVDGVNDHTCNCTVSRTGKNCESLRLYDSCSTPAAVSNECGSTVADPLGCFKLGANAPFCVYAGSVCPAGTVKFGSQNNAPCLVQCDVGPFGGCSSPFTKCAPVYESDPTGLAYCVK